MSFVAFLKLFITLVWNYLHREIFDKLCEVAPDVSNCNIKRLLELNEPITISDLFRWEEVLLLRHLCKSIGIDGALVWEQGRR